MVEASVGERVRPVRVDPDVGAVRQLGERGAPGGGVEIDERTSLAETGAQDCGRKGCGTAQLEVVDGERGSGYELVDVFELLTE